MREYGLPVIKPGVVTPPFCPPGTPGTELPGPELPGPELPGPELPGPEFPTLEETPPLVRRPLTKSLRLDCPLLLEDVVTTKKRTNRVPLGTLLMEEGRTKLCSAGRNLKAALRLVGELCALSYVMPALERR